MGSDLHPCRAPWRPGELLTQVAATWQQALRDGSLCPIATRGTIVLDAGIRFQVRVLASTDHKSAAHRHAQRCGPCAHRYADPFLPHDARLCVGAISPTHVCLLNKYPALDHHLLVVTQAFEPQDAPLTAADFAALWTCMRELDGLAFFNSGPMSGASQRHKHLQLVPLPLLAGEPAFPLAPLLDTGLRADTPTRIDALPFVHLGVRLDLDASTTCQAAPLQAAYERLCRDTHTPYNLLLTRRWMLWVPRSREALGRISVNALGFAGSLLVRDQEELQQVHTAGPMGVLAHVGLTPPEAA